MAETMIQYIHEQTKRLTKAQIYKNTEEEAEAYHNLGRAYCCLEEFHQAIEYLKQYLSIAEEVGYRAKSAKSAYCNLGHAYQSLGDYQRAIDYHNQHLRIAKELGDRACEECAYARLGVAYNSLNEFQRAIEYHNQHLRIAEEVGDRAGQSKAYSNLGLAYYSLNEFQRAIDYYNKYLSIAKEVDDRAGKGCAYEHLGRAYHSLKKFQRAIEYHNQHLSIAKEDGDRAGERCAYDNLGHVYDSLREFQQAIECHNQHLSIAKEVGSRECEGTAYGHIGYRYMQLDEYQRAKEYTNNGLIIAREVGDRKLQLQCYGNLGVIYQSLGEYQQAIECTNKCIIICQKLGDRAGEGKGYGTLSRIYSLLGKYQRAIEYANAYLKIAKEVGDRELECNAYSCLGTVYDKCQEFPSAMECYKKQLSIAKEVGNRKEKGSANLLIGGVHQSLGDVAKAMEYHKQCLSNAEEIGDRDGQGKAYCHLGGCYRELEDLKEAIECFQKHLSIAEEIGDKKGEACAHSKLGRSFLHPDSRSLNKALEHFRCSVKVYDSIRASSISEDELKISFRKKHQFAYNHLWPLLVNLDRNDEALYAAERGRAQALLDALKVTYGLTSLSARLIESEEEVRNISRNTTVLTVFLVLHLETVNIWVLGKEGNPIFRRKRLDIGLEHKGSITLLLDTVLKNRCENRCELQPLYDAVLGPIEDLLDGDELIVVPDGALSKAPWAALSETLRIRTVPSLTSLKVITDSPCEYHSKSGALLVGDPCLKKITDKQGKPIYDPLKYARMEVEMIGKILKSQPLTGEDATKEAVLQRIGSVALVHIAAHGKKETGEIFLASDPRCGSKPPKEEDCIMKMSDIQAVRLRARLVVLSCCYSGQGEVSPEGVVGMARAFLFSGARSVLATLWAIDDEATMMFMKSFYQQLASGESASVALQRAMKCLRDSKEVGDHDYSAPKYWAPFVLMGDDVKIELEKESLSKSDALKV